MHEDSSTLAVSCDTACFSKLQTGPSNLPVSCSGPVGDKKMMSEFRRKQQEARKKLDKERAKWQAGKAERGKVKAEAKKREIEAERRLHAERMRAEQELAE